MEKHFIAHLDEIPPGTRKRVRAQQIDIVVFNIKGIFYAIKDSCPHLGESLSRGSIQDAILTCPGHSWKFDLRTGGCIKGDEGMSLRTFDTIAEGDDLYVILT